MPDVDVHFPHEPTMSKERFLSLRLPEKLRGLDDRRVAQIVFENWLRENPTSAKRYESNPEHWNGT